MLPVVKGNGWMIFQVKDNGWMLPVVNGNGRIIPDVKGNGCKILEFKDKRSLRIRLVKSFLSSLKKMMNNN